MIDVLICGIGGKMGGAVCQVLQADGDMRVVCGVDKLNSEQNLPIYSSFDGIDKKVDVIIDFSSPTALFEELEWAKTKYIPVILAATGYTDEQQSYIEKCSNEIAIFKTANFSVGVNLICKLVNWAAKSLGEGFDIEIVERHHKLKADAPSGTALMLAESANSALGGNKKYINGRCGFERRGNEIGLHAVRGGTIVGEHEVIFAGEEEIITLTHSARSKKVFAAGAVKAAKWIAGKPAGLYDMTDLLENL